MAHETVPATVLLALRHVVKTFGAVVALADGSLEIGPGSIHALMGENGAGKSTLVKVLAGVHQPDSGSFLVDGEAVVFRSPADSKARGISVIHQEPTLFPDLTVAENIFVGRQPRNGLGPVDRARMRSEVFNLDRQLERHDH